MTIRLLNTDARQINEALHKMRKEGGSTSGQVLTLVVATTLDDYEQATEQAQVAGRMHPSRILVAIRGLGQHSGLNAMFLESSAATEVITLEMSGDVDKHANSVLLPLLLPELPVVIWWPNQAPTDLANCDLAGLSERRITHVSGNSDAIDTLYKQSEFHQPGSTDLAWTRLTRWRALLVAALDQVRSPVISAKVHGPSTSAPAVLMQAWLEIRLKAPVELVTSDSSRPGLYSVQLETEAGEIRLERNTDTEATLTLPGQPARPVALARRSVDQLLAEELMRPTGDETFDELMVHLRNHQRSEA